jgi:hypothetical protein
LPSRLQANLSKTASFIVFLKFVDQIIAVLEPSDHALVTFRPFVVPVFVVDQPVERIKDGTITGYRYDPNSAKLGHWGKVVVGTKTPFFGRSPNGGFRSGEVKNALSFKGD